MVRGQSVGCILALVLVALVSSQSVALAYDVKGKNQVVPTSSPSEVALNATDPQHRHQATCRVHQAAIEHRLQVIVIRAQNLQTKFNDATSKVDTFYQTKVVAQGKTIATYPLLVNKAHTSQAAVASALQAVQSQVTTFSCTTSDPQTQLLTTRQSIQALNAALQNYRAAVKDLIGTVRKTYESQPNAK